MSLPGNSQAASHHPPPLSITPARLQCAACPLPHEESEEATELAKRETFDIRTHGLDQTALENEAAAETDGRGPRQNRRRSGEYHRDQVHRLHLTARAGSRKGHRRRPPRAEPGPAIHHPRHHRRSAGAAVAQALSRHLGRGGLASAPPNRTRRFSKSCSYRI